MNAREFVTRYIIARATCSDTSTKEDIDDALKAWSAINAEFPKPYPTPPTAEEVAKAMLDMGAVPEPPPESPKCCETCAYCDYAGKTRQCMGCSPTQQVYTNWTEKAEES